MFTIFKICPLKKKFPYSLSDQLKPDCGDEQSAGQGLTCHTYFILSQDPDQFPQPKYKLVISYIYIISALLKAIGRNKSSNQWSGLLTFSPYIYADSSTARPLRT